MKKKIFFWIFSVLLIFCRCDFSNQVPIYLIIYSEDIRNYNDSIYLWINDALIYGGKYKPGYKSDVDFSMRVGYMKKDSTSNRLRIKIDTQDTTFIHKQKECMDDLTIRYHDYLELTRFSIDTIKIGYD